MSRVDTGWGAAHPAPFRAYLLQEASDVEADAVQAFRDSIRTGQEPEMSGAEGLRDLGVVLKAYESMAQGVSLPL